MKVNDRVIITEDSIKPMEALHKQITTPSRRDMAIARKCLANKTSGIVTRVIKDSYIDVDFQGEKLIEMDIDYFVNISA